MPLRFPPYPQSGPLSGGQWLAAIVGVIVAASAIVLGFVVFFVLFFAALLAWLVFSIRSRWHLRKSPQTRGGGVSGRGDTLEGEFKVLGEEQRARSEDRYRG